MTELATESRLEQAEGLDALSPAVILSMLHEGQMNAASVVAQSIPAIARAAELLSNTLMKGGNILYAAAGSSALMALADCLELPGTFGIHQDRLKILIAGGASSLTDMVGSSEDDATQAKADMNDAKISAADCLICVSASGTTPYAVGAFDAAKKAGVKIISIANNPDTPISNGADVAIYLETPPEIIPGSTRLGAATAQKITLNMMSTLMAVHLGHVFDGYMVNVRADNAKLVQRACCIICNITGCSGDEAQKYLDNSDDSVKLAVMLASGAPNIAAANEILESNGYKLRPSLSVLQGQRP